MDKALIYGVCVILSGLIYGERESIIRNLRNPNHHKLWFDSKWWKGIWMPKNKLVYWLFKYVLAWFRDGYHSLIFISITLLVAPLFYKLYQFEGLIYYIIVMSFHGYVAQISLHDKLFFWK